MIHWLLQRDADEMPAAGWLSAAEQARLALFRSQKRQQEWLLGRWTAKRLVQRYLEQETGLPPPLDALVIVRDPGGAPTALFDSAATPMDLPAAARWISGASLLGDAERKPEGEPIVASGMRLPVSLSISHSHGTALCALHSALRDPWQEECVSTDFPGGGVTMIGADIELVEARSPAFLQAYLAPEEQAWLQRSPTDEQMALATTIWSAKEAVLKALWIGLTVDTRRVVCLPASAYSENHVDWLAVQVHCDSTLPPEALHRAGWPAEAIGPWQLRGWWRRQDRFTLTLAALHIANRAEK